MAADRRGLKDPHRGTVEHASGDELGLSQDTVRFARDMGVSHTDFFRTLPAALGHRPYSVENGGVRIEEGDRRILLRLFEQSERVIGALRLPVTRVEFVFAGYPEAEIRVFMRRFDMHFQRGGG